MFNRIRLFFIVSIFIVSNAWANNDINPLDRFLDEFKTFSGDFDQNLIDVTGEVIETSKGRLYLKYPGQFNWQYTEPYAQSLISNAQKLWIYDADLEQVTIKDVNGEFDNTPAAILSGKETLYDFFKIIKQSNDKQADFIELAPISEDNQFHKVKLGFLNNQLVQMVLFDKLGQITEITFNNIKLNTELDNNLFTYISTDNVDVIDTTREAIE